MFVCKQRFKGSPEDSVSCEGSCVESSIDSGGLTPVGKTLWRD